MYKTHDVCQAHVKTPCVSNTSDHKDWHGSGLAGGALAVSSGILMSTCRTGVSRLARRKDLAAPEAGDSLEDALLACVTICFQVAMAAYRTIVNEELATSYGIFFTKKDQKASMVVGHEKLGTLLSSLAIVSLPLL